MVFPHRWALRARLRPRYIDGIARLDLDLGPSSQLALEVAAV